MQILHIANSDKPVEFYKTFLKSFLSDVFIYEEEQKDGRILRGLRFKFPIYMNGRNVFGVDWDNENTDETVLPVWQDA